MSSLSRAIWSLCPSAEFSYENDDYSTIKWIVQPEVIPTQEEITNEITRLIEQDRIDEEQRKEQRKALLDRLGITEEEAKLLLF